MVNHLWWYILEFCWINKSNLCINYSNDNFILLYINLHVYYYYKRAWSQIYWIIMFMYISLTLFDNKQCQYISTYTLECESNFHNFLPSLSRSVNLSPDDNLCSLFFPFFRLFVYVSDEIWNDMSHLKQFK